MQNSFKLVFFFQFNIKETRMYLNKQTRKKSYVIESLFVQNWYPMRLQNVQIGPNSQRLQLLKKKQDYF